MTLLARRHRLVQEEGVESWVRKTADRRVDPRSSPDHHEWYIQQMSQTSSRVVMETLAYLSTQDLSPVLPHIKTPTLILVAENSDANDPSRTDDMARLMPNARLMEIPGASGYVQHTTPEKCVAVWQEFVGGISQGKCPADN